MLFVVASTMYADEITIHNKTKQDMYGAAYYTDGDAKRSGNIYFIKAESSLKLERPGWEFGKYREFAFDYFKQSLTEKISESMFENMFSMDIGWTEGTEFWIAKKAGVLKTFTLIEWKVFKPIQDAFEVAGQKLLEPLFADAKKRAAQAPYAKTTAKVRTGTQLAPEEIAFRKKRSEYIKKGILKMTGEKVVDNRVLPIIGTVISGGGYRAMISAASFLDIADTLGFLDSLMYISVLSGSTWATTAWEVGNKTPAQFNSDVKKRGQTDLATPIMTPAQIGLLVDNLIMKTLFKQKITLVDLWGALIARKLLIDFGDQHQIVGFTTAKKYVNTGAKPLPIGTAVSSNIATKATDYKWFEFTPYEVGSIFLKAFIPTWAFGRRFENGVSQNFAPEQSLGFLMGTFGSAFTGNMGDLMDKVKFGGKTISFFLQPILDGFKIDIEEVRKFRSLKGAIVPNFAYGLATTPKSARFQDHIELNDAGWAIGDPIPPLLRPERKMDIIFVLDVNDQLFGGPAVHFALAEKYAKQNNLKFPPIDLNKAATQNVSVFGDPKDPSQLVIIFVPYIQNKKLITPYGNYDAQKAALTPGGFANTFAMAYGREEMNLVSGFVRENLIYIAGTIRDVIKQRIEAKRKALGIAKTVQEKLPTPFK